MRDRLGALLTLGLAIAGPAAVVGAPGRAAAQEPDAVRIHEAERTYAVTGATDEEVWKSLVAGARREGDELVFAWTNVSTEYRSRMVREEGVCRVVGARVDVRVTVTLPAWVPPRDAPLALRRQWNRYELAIQRHEEGHVRRARQTGRRLYEALVGLAAPDCETLEERGTTVGERILAEGRREQERYDEETGHGRTQGVEWVIDRRRVGR